MRPIDADALIAEYDRVHVGAPGDARKLMENAPTIEAVPVIHGRWKKIPGQGYSYKSIYGIVEGTLEVCSVCKRPRFSVMKTKFCPHCGNIMDGESEVKA